MQSAKKTFVRAYFDNVFEGSTIQKPMSPAEWNSDVSYKPITRILMTCGGGVGGSRWFEYVERIPLEQLASDETSCIVQTWDGKSLLINKSYIVTAEQLTIASAVLKSRNPHFPIGEYTYCYLVEDGHNIQLVDDVRPAI